MESLDVVVIGAGVVGLAVARALSQSGRHVIVLEAEGRFGLHASSRNSEVIHAGIYYPQGSLKARFCVQGKQQLYQYCGERAINHQRIGKLIVACTEDERAPLSQISNQASACGVTDLRTLNKADMSQLEPEITALEGLLSPSTGIIDSHQLMLSFIGDLQRSGGELVLESPVRTGVLSDSIELSIGGISNCIVSCNTVVNCAGLWAAELAANIGISAERLPETHYARGQYYSLTGASPFKHLVYPLPTAAGLGIHVTLDLNGSARFGPDVQWIDRVSYDFDTGRETAFRDAISHYYPGIQDRSLAPGHTGVRAKIVGPNQTAADFQIDSHAFKNGTGLINLYGIESPGLTASMALAEHVTQLVRHQ